MVAEVFQVVFVSDDVVHVLKHLHESTWVYQGCVEVVYVVMVVSHNLRWGPDGGSLSQVCIFGARQEFGVMSFGGGDAFVP